MAACIKCGKDAHEGSGSCPVYHGRLHDGFCPAFADGETCLETCTRFHDWWITECDRNDALMKKLWRVPKWIRRWYSLNDFWETKR